jgi:hypothetical protein
MSTVDKTKHSGTRPEAEENVDDIYNYDDYDVSLDPEMDVEGDTETGDTTHTTSGGYTPPTGSGSKNLGTGGVAPGGDPGFPDPETAYQQAQQQVQQWRAQGKSPEWIQQQLQAQGWPAEDAYYLAQGGGFTVYGEDGLPTQYGNPKIGNLGTGQPDLMKFMMDSQNLQEAKNTQRSAKRVAHEQKIKIHMILLQIMMGDIVGALRSYAILMDRDMRQFTRLIVNKLDKVRKARSTVIRNFARTKPPRAYAGNNPSQAARAQDRSSRYTQFVQMSTQLMNELQNTERELVDALQTMHRNLQTFWESYAGFRDQEFRTNERVMTTR